MSKSTKQNLLLALLLTIIAFGGIYLYQVKKYNRVVAINSFDLCAAAGYPIMESYPARCMTPDGRSFVQPLEGKITVTGSTICLPHKDTSGPTTLECALGIKDSYGNNYGLSDPDMKFTKDISNMNDTITVTGTLSLDQNSKYDTLGVIQVESVTR